MADDPLLAYWKWLLTLPLPYQWPYEDFSKRQTARAEIHQAFPFVVTLEKDSDELEYLEQWCKDEFGPKHGTCTDKLCWYENSFNLFYSSSADNKDLTHFHSGNWTTVWALKTSYYDGFCDFCFKLSKDAVYFKFTFGFDY